MAREAETIGARMKELREGRGLTQREFADLLPGKTEGKDVSRWENGKHRPSPDTLSAIADALETTVADLHAGPLSSRKAKGPTPDPFAATRKAGAESDAVADLQAQIAELLEVSESRHSALLSKLSEVSDELEQMRKREQLPGRGRAKGGTG
jgi:transcriptional regulator with XRE-family HTH domain